MDILVKTLNKQCHVKLCASFCFRAKCCGSAGQHAASRAVSDATDYTGSGSNIDSKWADSVSDHPFPCPGVCDGNPKYNSGIGWSGADDTAVESGVCS